MGYYELNLQRKQEIEEGLLALMQQKLFEQITIKDLTENLHMARKTFYHYFSNKWDCLKSLTDRLLYECNLRVMQEASVEDTAGIYRTRLQFWIEHRDYLDVINRNKLGSFFLNQILQYLLREEKNMHDKLSTPEVQYDEDILFFYMSGQIFLLLKWCHEGFALSLEEMVQKNMRLVCEPLIKPEKE